LLKRDNIIPLGWCLLCFIVLLITISITAHSAASETERNSLNPKASLTRKTHIQNSMLELSFNRSKVKNVKWYVLGLVLMQLGMSDKVWTHLDIGSKDPYWCDRSSFCKGTGT
jgi:phosphatidylglycerophosphate synthase